MKIKNISEKIVHIGPTMLMPGKDMNASDVICNLPAIKAMAKAGLVEVIKTAEEKPKRGRGKNADKKAPEAPEEQNVQPDPNPQEPKAETDAEAEASE